MPPAPSTLPPSPPFPLTLEHPTIARLGNFLPWTPQVSFRNSFISTLSPSASPQPASPPHINLTSPLCTYVYLKGIYTLSPKPYTLSELQSQKCLHRMIVNGKSPLYL
ncbi:hypothetical protein E2C01_096708 [Portunus trituberculatus]|uniref:Uncharacterized protein n=1 Tax=Portunus trituberculatus TaxID=210409 RepID=A0A5B7K2G5_PORTR|nr:hypothetical protein [Portunus trituberculatus]